MPQREHRETVDVADLLLVRTPHPVRGTLLGHPVVLGHRVSQGRDVVGRLVASQIGMTQLAMRCWMLGMAKGSTPGFPDRRRGLPARCVVVGRETGRHHDQPEGGHHRHEHRALEIGMRGHEPDQRRTDQERGVPEADHQGESAATADVPGKTVDLGRDQADAEPDQAPPEQDQRKPGGERGEQVADQRADRAATHDRRAAEPLDHRVAEEPDHHHEAADAGQAPGARLGLTSPTSVTWSDDQSTAVPSVSPKQTAIAASSQATGGIRPRPVAPPPSVRGLRA